MPITRETWENFFQGNFAEHHVSSLFYFVGYEAQKLSPDVGIDWMVTNVARARFNGEEPLQIEVQVKSALLDRKGAFLSMSGDELDFLSEGQQRYTVVVLLHGFSGSSDPGSFERGDDPDASMAVDQMILEYKEGRAHDAGRQLRRQGEFSIYDFTKADVTVFWLHSSQMKRLRDEGRWKKQPSGFLGLPVSVDHGVVIDRVALIRELLDLSFIVRNCRAAKRIRSGHMSMEDY
jgi:hypothetical protein